MSERRRWWRRLLMVVLAVGLALAPTGQLAAETRPAEDGAPEQSDPPVLPMTGQMSRQSFTDVFAGEMRKAMPERAVSIKAPLEIRYQLADGSWSTVLLENAFRMYRARPAEGATIVRHFVRVYATLARDAEAPVDAARIVPVIKDRRWLEGAVKALRKQSRKGDGKIGETPLNERLGRDLVVLYAEDRPSHLRYLTAAQIAKAGVKRSELRDRAIRNLRQSMPRVQFRHRPDIGAIEAGGMHEASLLLVPEVWIELKGKVDGDPVIAVPSRGKLLFTGSRNTDAVRTLRRMAAEMARTSSDPLTEHLFVIRAGKVETLR